jgi:short-subunit dehydrogenase
MKIEGSTILLTGASSGVGAALAPLLAERGARLGVVARRRDLLEKTLARCQEHSADSRMWVADLSDVDAATNIAEEAWAAFGGLDCLVNNAAIAMRKHLLDHTPQDLDLVMRTNYFSPVRMALTVIPKMLERGSGTVVNVASGGGRFGIVHESAYCSAKFALSGWSEVAAMELLGTPVELKLMQLGAIKTAMHDQKPGELPGLPGAEFISPEECAAGILAAMERDGFEFFVPEDLKALVDGKNADPFSWVEMMSGLGRVVDPAGYEARA